MDKLRGVKKTYLDWVFRSLSVKLDNAAFIVLFLMVFALRGPAPACAWAGLALFARLASGYAVRRCAKRRPALSHLVMALKPLGEGLILALGLTWAGLALSAAAPGAAIVVMFTLLGFRLASRAARATRIAAAPLALAILLMLFVTVTRGQSALATALCLGAAFAAIGYALFQTHQKLQNATREAAFLAQVLKQNDCPVDAIWRLDFRTQSLTGGPQFTPLIGKTLQFSDVASDLFSAGEHERDLVAGAFAPCRGPARYLFITHSAPVGDGRHVRLVHRAILQTGAMGRPLSLACVTSLAPVQSAQLPLNEQWKALRAHYGAAVEETRLDGQAPAPPSQALRARA